MPTSRVIPHRHPSLPQRLDPAAFVYEPPGSADWALLVRGPVRLRDGLRVPGAEAEALGLVRPSNIRDQRLQDDDLAPPSAEVPARDQIAPYEVVLTKLGVPRAAVVLPSTRRRGVDANCFRLAGITAHPAVFTAHLFETQPVRDHLAHRSHSAVIQRVGLRDLRELRLPDPPAEAGPVADAWLKAAGELDRANVAFDRHAGRVLESVVSSGLPEVAPPRAAFYDPDDLAEVWTPDAQALRRFQQRALAVGWQPLSRWMPAAETRLRTEPEGPSRFLRLRSATSRLRFDLPAPEALIGPAFRVLARPLAQGDVLLSLLGSQPKVVVAPPVRQAPEVWLTDHWARLAQARWPHVLGILLGSAPVAAQLVASAGGLIQQYVTRSDLERVVVPPFPEDVALLEDRLVEVQRAHHTALVDLHKASAAILRLANQALGVTP